MRNRQKTCTIEAASVGGFFHCLRYPIIGTGCLFQTEVRPYFGAALAAG